MAVYKFNPLNDRRWQEFLQTRVDASAFHTTAWLQTLYATYGYNPIVFTTSPPGTALTNGIVFCEIKSWITGKRWVSLPFADHCAPLCDSNADLHTLLEGIAQESCKCGVGRVEIRPMNAVNAGWKEHTSFTTGDSFKLHLLNLAPSLESILRSCDRSSVQRRLRHATRENLSYAEGRSDAILKDFYHLMIQTRRRHGVPPQPIAWFRNLLTFMGDNVTIRVASIGETPVGSLLTLTHNGTVIYKYGCSDERQHKLGGMVSLFWRSIEDAKARGAHTFDMGRSDLDNPGLMRFKSNWGARELPLTYWQFPQTSPATLARWAKTMGGNLLSRLPDGFLVAIGNALYRHAG